MAVRTERADKPQARKRFGQNFLEPVWAEKVVAAIAPKADEAFIEIGPGPGALTRPLAAASASLVACELDRDLAALLRDEAIPRVRILQGDFLKLPLKTLRDTLAEHAPGAIQFRVAGNLPYNVASPIMFRLVDLHRQGLPLTDATIMLQREVADRLLASTGTSDYSLLTVLVGHRAKVTRLLNLPPGAFRPAPKVQSTVVRLAFHAPLPPVTSEQVLAGVTSAVFSRRRKTMGNALQAYGQIGGPEAAALLQQAGIDPVRRPETLSIAEFARVADLVAARGSENPAG